MKADKKTGRGLGIASSSILDLGLRPPASPERLAMAGGRNPKSKASVQETREGVKEKGSSLLLTLMTLCTSKHRKEGRSQPGKHKRPEVWKNGESRTSHVMVIMFSQRFFFSSKIASNSAITSKSFGRPAARLVRINCSRPRQKHLISKTSISAE